MPKTVQQYRRALQHITVGKDCPLAGTVVVPSNVSPRDAARMAMAALRPIVVAKIEKISSR